MFPSMYDIYEYMNLEDNDVFIQFRCSGPGLSDCLGTERLAVSR